MNEYIEREAALNICQKKYEDHLRMFDYCGDTVAWNIGEAIKGILAADVVPVKHTSITRDQVEKMWRGEWIIRQDEYKEYIKKCSKCGFPISGWWGAGKFCPHCGAPMTDDAVQMVMEKLEVLYGNR